MFETCGLDEKTGIKHEGEQGERMICKGHPLDTYMKESSKIVCDGVEEVRR